MNLLPFILFCLTSFCLLSDRFNSFHVVALSSFPIVSSCYFFFRAVSLSFIYSPYFDLTFGFVNLGILSFTSALRPTLLSVSFTLGYFHLFLLSVLTLFSVSLILGYFHLLLLSVFDLTFSFVYLGIPSFTSALRLWHYFQFHLPWDTFIYFCSPSFALTFSFVNLGILLFTFALRLLTLISVPFTSGYFYLLLLSVFDLNFSSLLGILSFTSDLCLLVHLSYSVSLSFLAFVLTNSHLNSPCILSLRFVFFSYVSLRLVSFHFVLLRTASFLVPFNLVSFSVSLLISSNFNSFTSNSIPLSPFILSTFYFASLPFNSYCPSSFMV